MKFRYGMLLALIAVAAQGLNAAAATTDSAFTRFKKGARTLISTDMCDSKATLKDRFTSINTNGVVTAAAIVGSAVTLGFLVNDLIAFAAENPELKATDLIVAYAKSVAAKNPALAAAALALTSVATVQVGKNVAFPVAREGYNAIAALLEPSFEKQLVKANAALKAAEDKKDAAAIDKAKALVAAIKAAQAAEVALADVKAKKDADITPEVATQAVPEVKEAEVIAAAEAKEAAIAAAIAAAKEAAALAEGPAKEAAIAAAKEAKEKADAMPVLVKAEKKDAVMETVAEARARLVKEAKDALAKAKAALAKAREEAKAPAAAK